jgi:small subunit ribosomal protein S20
MPIKKSAMKAMRQTKKRTERNQKVKGNIEYLRRSIRQSLESKDVKGAGEMTQSLIKQVDKAVQNGVLKQNTGNRIKSRLMKKLNVANKK